MWAIAMSLSRVFYKESPDPTRRMGFLVMLYVRRTYHRLAQYGYVCNAQARGIEDKSEQVSFAIITVHLCQGTLQSDCWLQMQLSVRRNVGGVEAFRNPRRSQSRLQSVLNFASCMVHLVYIPFFTEFTSCMICPSRVFYMHFLVKVIGQ